MEKPIRSNLKAQSPTRDKTLENCSWLYWCNYHLKIPQEQNEGAKKGNICHKVFELLLSKKEQRKWMVDKIILSGTIDVCQPVKRLVKRFIKKAEVHDSNEAFHLIDKMILVGLENDFYGAGGTIISPEFKFDIVSDKPKFRIKGLIDKPFIRGSEIVIDDYKSSKKKFAGEDYESNLQALFYSYAAKKLWPNLKPIVRFIFLQHPKDPIMSLSFEDDALLGFEYYLEATQLRIDGFNEQVAYHHFAFDEPAAKDEFKGKCLCGFASSKNQLKKDGTKMWACPYKFPFEYYVVCKDNEIIRTALNKNDLYPLKKDELITERKYEGCPRHTCFSDAVPGAPPPKKFNNVLDDF